MDINAQLKRLADKPNLLAKVDEIVKKEIDEGNIPAGTRMVGVGILDSEGIKLVAAVELLKNNTEKSLKIKAIFEHDWDGDDSVAGKIIFSSK